MNTGLALLAVFWLAGIVIYFAFTTERTRENVLLVIWILLLLPTFLYPIIRLFAP